MPVFGLRHTIDRRLLLRACVAGAGFCAVRPGLSAEQAIGSVSEVVGEAVAELNDRRRKLTRKSSVFLDDTVRTGARSRLRAFLARKTSLRLGAETSVRIDRFIIDSGGELVLDSGALLIDTQGKLLESLEVESPYALIAVRGTRFFAGPIDGVFGVFVARGSVDVTAAGTTVRLGAGEGTDIARAGAAPGPVKVWGQPKIRKAMALVR